MSRVMVNSVQRLPPRAISGENGESGSSRSESIFRLLLDLDARLRKQRREEAKMAFGRRQIFQADRIR